MNAKELNALLESELKQYLTENISKGYTVVYRDKAFDKTYTAQIPPGISKAEIVKMLKKTIRVGLEIVGITPLKESVNEGAIQDIEARLASAKKGAKASGGGYSGWVKTGRNSWKNKKTGRNAHNRALASQLGGFSDFKINEDTVNEAMNPKKAANALFDKLAVSKLIGKQNRARAVAVLASMLANMKISEGKLGDDVR